ncbi:hypothetical protein FHE25_00070 [Salmonella enterica]|uniref:hypothetical protein n=1 Tax=Salmonella enterica TaxID=28901 RepID=UPI0009AECACE|nr:hypothetical protein [Salmonella enterica]EDQ9541720.1 hypothetical protein [Salmonella enterica subsp. enterica]EAM8207372.1 hypothetical protein [Salmonella enterica]EAQ8844954.1 hypothetical protein [Salmonella enterica]EAR6583801.1 hypothetical protein [Salmonella enterica]EAV1932718.1 hypothetical protein [Salmonella enterica]
MQQVKIYTASPSDLSPPVQSESFCVDMVLASDYAELEEKFMALAAENAGLKAAIDSTIGWQQSTDPVNVESVRMLVDIETPATDAFLAEVRAQGVEMFADKYRAQLTALPTTPENIFDAAHVSLRYQIFDADEFAAQLRKGAAL